MNSENKCFIGLAIISRLIVFVFVVCMLSDGHAQIRNDSVWIQSDKGCKIYNPHPLRNERITWTGPCPEGYAEGKGILTWYKKGRENQVYTGFLKRGIPNGRGKYHYGDSEIHEGVYLDGELQGEGTMIIRDGNNIVYTYHGRFRNGTPDGFGQEVGFSEAGDTLSKYTGDFKDWDREGMGLLKEYKHNIVTVLVRGQFRHDKLDGKVEIREFSNSKLKRYYVGDFRSDGRNGYGMEVVGNNIYKGQWSDNQKNGKGKLLMDSVLIYEGDWRKNKFHGVGKRYYFDGTYSFAEFKNNARDGFGIVRWKDGTRYIGEFKNDLYHGMGYFANGETEKILLAGHWEGGSLYLKDDFSEVKEGLATKHKERFFSFSP